jgi:hypothetical protein
MRCLLPFAAAATLLSCGIPPSVNRADYAPNSGPTITGRTEFISHSEVQVALASARNRLATLAPSSPIFRVNVISPTRVEAFYCAGYDRDRTDLFYQNQPRTGYLLLERRSGQWRILPGHETRVIEDSHDIIIT